MQNYIKKSENKLNSFALENRELTLNHVLGSESAFRTFLYDVNSPAKAELEQFISDTFERYYHAHLLHFYPYLLGAYDEYQKPYAAVGYRVASEQRLFLEQYLQNPVEVALSASAFNDQNTLFLEPLSRRHIVEIGNLAATQQGACRKIFQLLTLYFHRGHYRWIVFTATRTVRVVLKRMRLEAYPLVSAKLTAIQQSEQRYWGTYYDQQPVVMAMPVNQSISTISSQYALESGAISLS